MASLTSDDLADLLSRLGYLIPGERYPLLGSFLKLTLQAGNIASRELASRMRGGGLTWDAGALGYCEDCLREITAFQSTTVYDLADTLQAYYATSASLSPNQEFQVIKARLYDRPFYPLREHLRYALPYGTSREGTILELVEQVTNSPMCVLDAGTGPGVLLARVLQRRTGAEGVGIDVSARCVEYASRFCEFLQLSERVRFSVQDIRRLAIRGASIDLIIASEVLEHIPSPAEALMQFQRILRDEGQLIVGVPIRLPLAMHLFDFEDVGQAVEMLEGAGFEVVSLRLYPLYFGAMDFSALCVKRSR